MKLEVNCGGFRPNTKSECCRGLVCFSIDELPELFDNLQRMFMDGRLSESEQEVLSSDSGQYISGGAEGESH